MVDNQVNELAAIQIAELLTGPLSSSAQYVLNLQNKFDECQPATVRQLMSVARVFSKWYQEEKQICLEGDIQQSLHLVICHYFESRRDQRRSSNKGHLCLLKCLFELHPSIMSAVSDRQWSDIGQRISSIACQSGRGRNSSVVQPILKRHVFAFAENIKVEIKVSPDLVRRQHLLGLRALGAIAHSGMFRGQSLSSLKVCNIEEIVTNISSRRQAYLDKLMRPMGIDPGAHVFDPPIGSVTCSVRIPDWEGDVISNIGPEMTSWVLEWLDSRTPWKDDEPLFFTRGGNNCQKALTPTSILALFREIIEGAGVEVRHANTNSFLYGAIVDHLLKGVGHFELNIWSRRNGRGVSMQRLMTIDEQLRAHTGPLDDFIIQF